MNVDFQNIKQMPFSVPEGYFDHLPDNMLKLVRSSELHSVIEEINELSPLLGTIGKTMPFVIPEGYFADEIVPPASRGRVVRIGRQWMRLAVAAVVTGIVAFFGYKFINQDRITPASDSYAWIKNSIQQVSNEKLSEFIELVNADSSDLSVAPTTNYPEVAVLLKSVPEEEIESFLNDTEILEQDPILN
jgi:hypothetical protein